MAAYTARDFVLHRQAAKPRVEYTDRPQAHDADTLQDTLLRMVRTHLREGNPLPQETDAVIDTLDQRPSYLTTANRSAHTDNRRKRKVRNQVVSLTTYAKQAEAIIDDRQEDELLTAESATAKDELDAFMGSATDAEKEAVTLLVQCQQLLHEGRVIPDAIRSKLARLRRQTGLALDLSLL